MIITCKYCDNQIDIDYDAEHEEMCGEDKFTKLENEIEELDLTVKAMKKDAQKGLDKILEELALIQLKTTR